MSYTHLNPCDRGRFQALHEEGKAVNEIAPTLGRHRTTIRRELTRNATGSAYQAVAARPFPTAGLPKSGPPTWRAATGSVIGKATRSWTPGQRGGLTTLVERKSRLLRASVCPSKEAETVADGIVRTLEEFLRRG